MRASSSPKRLPSMSRLPRISSTPKTPACTPEPIIDWLSREILAVLADPKTKARANGAEITPTTPAEMGRRIPQDIKMWRKLIEDAHVTLQ